MSAKTKDIIDLSPIWKVERDCILSVWGDTTVVFEVTLPEIFTMSALVETQGESRHETGEFRELNELWVKAFGVLPENTILHKQDWFTVEQYAPKYAINSFLDKASEQHFNERPYLYHKCYLFLTKTHDQRRGVSSAKTTLVTGRIVPKEIFDLKKQEEFFNSIEQFVSILTSSRTIELRRLTSHELSSDDGHPGLIERYMSLSLNDEVVPLCDIRNDGDVMVGNKFIRYYSIADIDDMADVVFTHNKVAALSTEKSTVSVGFAAPVSLMLNVNHIYNQYIFKVDKRVVFPSLEARAQQMTALGSFSKNNESNARLINNYLTYAADTGYPPVQCHFNVMVWTDDKAKLPLIRNLTTSAISRMGLRPRENSTDAMSLFWAGIPGAASDLPTEDKFWTFVPQACCMLNQESTTSSDLSTYGVKLTDRLSGKPILVDLSDVPMSRGWVSNRNKFILGPSGSGKSFLTNHLIRSYIAQGAHAVIVDVGHSYEGLCDMLGGRYLTYTPDSPISFNPFYIESRMAPDIEKIEAVKALLMSLWKKEEENFARVEEVTFSLTVTGYFARLEEDQTILPCFNTYYEYLVNDFPAVLAEKGVKAHHFDFEGFKLTMEPFYKGGEYDYLLNSATNIDLTSVPLVVFELDNIKDHKIIFPVVTIMIMDTFITKMRRLEGVRKIILIEEAWKAIMNEKMAEYIKYLYKTVRKFYGEAWIVTQQVKDIVGNKIVQDTIIANADTKIIMDMRKEVHSFDKVQEFLGLSVKEKNLALSLNRDLDPAHKYKEFFVSHGGQSCAVYGVEVSRAEYAAFTTEQPEKLALKKQLARCGGNYELAIRQLIEEQEVA